jgi:hypothetical protein
MPRCPRRSGRPPPGRRRWSGSAGRRTPGCPVGTPCRRGRNTDIPAIPSLWHAASSGVSEPSVELRGSRQSPGSRAPWYAGLELRPLPSTGVTRLRRYYGPVRHPRAGPACPSRASGWRSRASADRGFPCCVCSPCVDMPLPLPRWDRWVRSLMGRPIPPVSLFANDDGLPHPVSGSAPTSLPFEACSAFTHVTACRLAAPPSGAFVSKAPTASLPPPPLR